MISINEILTNFAIKKKKKRLFGGYFRVERISMSESLERRLRVRLVGKMEK